MDRSEIETLKDRVCNDVFYFHLFKTNGSNENEILLPAKDGEGNDTWIYMTIDDFVEQLSLDDTLRRAYMTFSREGRQALFADIKFDDD